LFRTTPKGFLFKKTRIHFYIGIARKVAIPCEFFPTNPYWGRKKGIFFP
jgi:hypothetical protein